jgi:hypothetical protein
MRNVRKVMLAGVFAAALGVGTAGTAGASPFPAQNEQQCTQAGGEWYQDGPNYRECIVTESDETMVSEAGNSGRAWYRVDETTVTYTRITGGGQPVEDIDVNTATWCVNPGGTTTGSDKPCT